MISSHISQVGVIIKRALFVVKLAWDEISTSAKTMFFIGTLFIIMVFGTIGTIIHNRAQLEIDEHDYNRMKDYAKLCPVKEDISAALANDGKITKYESAKITGKCSEFIEIQNRNKARDEVKQIITNTEDDS